MDIGQKIVSEGDRENKHRLLKLLNNFHVATTFKMLLKLQQSPASVLRLDL
jgi:hypothetical protein